MKILSLFTLLIVFTACGNANNEMSYEADDVYYDLAEVVPEATSAPRSKSTSEHIEVTKKVIKTGGITFESKNIQNTYKRIKNLLPKYDAYIDNEQQTKSTERIDYYMSVRVPFQAYDTLYTSISNLAIKLDSKHSNIEDVTERYYDLKSRINNKKALEKRYLQLLTKAKEMKDILAIEEKLNEVRTDIERLQGQFNFLSKQVNFSTVNISFYEILPYAYDSSQREGFGARLLSALDSGWQGLLSFGVGIVYVWPFILLALIIGFLALRKFKK